MTWRPAFSRRISLRHFSAAALLLPVFFAGCATSGGSSAFGPGAPGAGSPLDLYLNGELQVEKGQLDLAIASLSDAIAKNPHMDLAYQARGEVYKQKGAYESAALDFKHVTEAEPYNFKATYELGLMYQYLKRFGEAVAAYQHAVEMRPLDKSANMNLALVYTQMGEPLRGLPYAQRAASSGDDAAAEANLGTLYSQSGYSSLAIAAYKKSIELDGRQPQVYTNLAQEYLQAGEYALARNTLETASNIAPSPAVSERLGLTYYKLKDYPKARHAFEDALRQNASYFQALNGLGVLSMTQSLGATPADLEAARQALAFWNHSLQIQPNQPVIRELIEKYTGTAQSPAK